MTRVSVWISLDRANKSCKIGQVSSIPNGQAGFVYVMTSDTLEQLGILKIGSTTHEPAVRAFQLSSSTSSPTPFRVLYSRFVSDCTMVEKVLHIRFAANRVHDGREFFRISLDDAAMALDDLCGGRQWVPEVPYPFAALFNTFPDDGSGRELTPEEQQACRRLEATL